MKNINYLLILLIMAFGFTACELDRADYDELGNDPALGGHLTIQSRLLTYVVGNQGPYTAKFQDEVSALKINSVDVYKRFVRAADGVSTNENLLTSITITETNNSFDFNYSGLIEGLVLEGNALPAIDSELSIGDFFEFSYHSNLENGETHVNPATTKVAVGTRLAGVYTVVESAYWNSGASIGDWNGDERIIESVNAAIYRHIWAGSWVNDDANNYYFTVDSATGIITVMDTDPDGNAITINDSPIMVCGGAYPFESLDCTINLATLNNETGADIVETTIGYFRGTGATRELYEKLVKNVD